MTTKDQPDNSMGLRTLNEAEWRAEAEGALILVRVPEGPLLRGSHVSDDDAITEELNAVHVGNLEADRQEAERRAGGHSR